MNKKQYGHGLMFLLLAVLVLALLGLGSWLVWRSMQTVPNTEATQVTTPTKTASYTNTKYGYSLDFSSKYHALAGLGEENGPLAQVNQLYILPIGQQLGQAGGETILMSVWQEGTDYSQQASRSMYMPDWELTFSNTTVGNSEAMQSHVVKYSGHPDLSTDDYLVKTKAGNAFFITVLHGNTDAQTMLNSFKGN